MPDIIETSTEFHFPGQQFTGPGTHVIAKLKADIQPANKTDFVTLLHDIDYLRTAGLPEKQRAADARALFYAPLDLPGVATNLGLLSRNFFGLTFNAPIKGLTAAETRQVGEQVWQWLLSSHYRRYFELYNISPSVYM